MKMHIFGRHLIETESIAQARRCMIEGSLAALMADSHVGYSQPIGGAIAYPHHISPSGVGFDIGCGNLASKTSLRAADVNVPRVMDAIATQISFGVARTNPEPADDPGIDRAAHAPLKR